MSQILFCYSFIISDRLLSDMIDSKKTELTLSAPADCLLIFARIALIFFLASLSLAAVSDLRYRSVPAHLERACFFFAVAGAFEKTLPLFVLKLSGCAFCFLLFFVLYVISKGKGLGGADVRIIAGSCAVLGFFPTFEALLIGSCLGLFYLITHHRFPNAPKTTIPLITFFALGCFVSKSLSSLILHTFFTMSVHSSVSTLN